MKWFDNTALATLVIAQNAVENMTTYERLCYHLVHDHGKPEWAVTQRSQTELENIHQRDHDNDKQLKHQHDKPIRICGYEPK